MPQRLPTFPVFDNFHVDVIATASATSKSPTNAFAGGNRWQRAITWSTDEALAVLEGKFVITRSFYCSGRADQPTYLQTAAPSTHQKRRRLNGTDDRITARITGQGG